MAKGIGIPHPDGKSVRVIMIPESGSDAALTADEQIMLALRDEVERLTAENANLRANMRGRTMYHSDADVNREMGLLREKVDRLLAEAVRP